MIYGRSEELSTLQEAFQWAALGSTELVFISGPPGIGKSALVLQAFRPTVQSDCKFAWGKFDPYQASNPYAPIVSCFQFLIRQLLTEPDSELDQWRRRIQEAVGDNGSVIAEVIPEVRLLIGDTAPSELLPASKSHHRFELIFRRFIRAFANAKHPLVLFFDDIQWADRATLVLLRSLLTDPDIQHLLMIGAYRDQDWNDNEHLFQQWLQGEHTGYSIRQLRLEPLDMAPVQAIVAEKLGCGYERCFPLAHALYVKTVGYPFYLEQLLNVAMEESIVRYSDALADWEWDLEKLARFPSFDGQVAYLVGRINGLPAASRRLLVAAACLGGAFSVRMLGAIARLSEREVAERLSAAVHAGLLAYREGGNEQTAYAFTHDRIHQAAYSLSNNRERMAIHLAAGRFLLDAQHAEAGEQALFETVNHLNEALELMSPDEREATCLLNEAAGRKAMQSAAFAEALGYFDKALTCLPDAYWDSRQEFTFQTHLRCAECEYLCTYYERAEARLDALLARARNWLQRAQVAKLKIDQYSNTGRYAQAIALGCEMLGEAGVRIPVKPVPDIVNEEMRAAKHVLERRMDELHTLPDAGDPRMLLMTELMVSLVGPTFFSNREVFALLSSKFIRLVCERGATPIASAVYAAYGMVLCTMLNDLQTGYRLGTIAMDVADRSGTASVKSKVYAMFHCVISPWMGYGAKDEKQLTDAVHYGLQSGDYVFASYAIGGLINMSYAVHPMKRMQQVMGQCLQYVEITKEELIYKNVMIYMQLAEMLQSSGLGDFALTVGRDTEEDFLEDVMKDESRAVTLYQIYTYKTQLAYLFGRHEDAIRYAELARPYEGLAVQSPHMPIVHFYEAMALAASLRKLASGDGEQRRRRLERRCGQFQSWSGMSAAYFGYKSMLLQAETLRQSGPEQDVIDLYDQAIRLARASADAQYWAVACECAARHHLDKGRVRIARGYMLEAYEAYGEWNVELKRARLRDEFPAWFREESDGVVPSSSRQVVPEAHQSRRAPAEHPAVRIMKDALAFSPDMNLPETRRRLIDLLMRTSGMTYGCLIRQRNDGLWVELAMSRGQPVLAEPERLERSLAVPRSFVQYAARWGEPVQIGHAVHDELFANDPYIVRHRCRSIGGFPIYAQQQLAGVLYLELPASAYPLSDELVEPLCLLAAQALFITKLLEAFGDGSGRGEHAALPEAERMIDPLTDRELEVLHFMSTGMTNKEIAVRLGVTAGTVKVHIHNIFSKLNVNRRMNAVAKAEQMNLLNRPDGLA